MYVWTLPGIGRPFWDSCRPSERGCHEFGSFITVPGSLTTIASFAGRYELSS